MRNRFLNNAPGHNKLFRTVSFLLLVSLAAGHASGGVWSGDESTDSIRCMLSDNADTDAVTIKLSPRLCRWNRVSRPKGRPVCIIAPVTPASCVNVSHGSNTTIADNIDPLATNVVPGATIRHPDESVKSWQSGSGTKVVLMIHGGCGVIPRNEMTPEMEKAHRAALESSLLAGYATLQKPGATSLDGVVEAIKVLEDSPLFNAGKGAVFTREGKNELDASIMEGRTKNAGAVASTTIIKNPIVAARLVMQKSGHVLMVGDGADQFARLMGAETVDPSYFATEFRKQQHLRGLKEIEIQEKQEHQQNLGINDRTDKVISPGLIRRGRRTEDFVGTVGAVAVDREGNISAGTSTGGLNNKRHGRVGDAPIIGAGNYADNESCAISSTGDGEFFLRAVAAHEISSRVKYKGLSIRDASQQVMAEIKREGGDGAVIVLTRSGVGAFSYNTEGMYRGYITSAGKTHVFIYSE